MLSWEGEAPAEPLHYGNARLGRSLALPELHFVASYRNPRLHPFMIDEQRVVATAGMFANMPVGTPHSFRNESSKPAKMLISVAPAGLEGMFFDVGVPLPEGSTTAFDHETVINPWKAIAECDDSTRGGKCGIVLYSTAEPCFMCSYVIRLAEIPCLATCWMWITGMR